ncbi:hypothetical protein AX774_g5431 [Zancudomyces culisetae]|uniref:Uncharacterized protein n=1 Tax=Zancudomyces culisetae TaxID=1213189 RepID=A0A1R1PJL1_ZANCU|nr:hypothetical protein AX774_g5431 [Zancudomyces culisetae]|eukprot:OMH81119.1 hypothetical protein AX774_g5431 [Zancudomyces culisetae]
MPLLYCELYPVESPSPEEFAANASMLLLLPVLTVFVAAVALALDPAAWLVFISLPSESQYRLMAFSTFPSDIYLAK